MLVLLFVALWFILRGDLFYVLPCVILFLCFSVLLALRLPRLRRRELVLVLFVRLFDLRLFGYTPGIPKGYIVFVGSVRPFACPSFVRQSVILSVNTCYNQVLLRSLLIMYISAATYQKLFVFGMQVPGRVLLHSTSMGRAQGRG